MNTRFHTIVGFTILLLGLAHQGVLMAQDMTVTGASPSDGEPGQELDIEIIGTGFDDSIDKVSFKLPCNKKSCPDSDEIAVESFTRESPTSIKAVIKISSVAQANTFDIALRSRGRGGKGTTYKGEGLFEVKLRPNQDLYDCDYFLENPRGTCNCEFVWNGDPSFRPALLEDCETSETLEITFSIRGSEGGSADGNGRTSITAVPCGSAVRQACTGLENGGVTPDTFYGRSVISNSTHRASIRYMDIRFKGVDRGCGIDAGIETAVSFTLKASTPNPKIPVLENRNSFLNIRDTGIYVEQEGSEIDPVPLDPLCHAMEIIREDGYTKEYSDGDDIARDWKIAINDNDIGAGSYEQAGIVMLGMMPSESINPPQVVGNSVGAAACGSGYPVGILFGDLTLDPANQIDGLIENNVIDMTNYCSNKETGILVVGDSRDVQTTVDVNKNTITGAFLGIDVDCHVTDANFSGNNLRGDGSGPTGILSDAVNSDTKGKPNKISGYTEADVDFSWGTCPPE